MSYSIQAFVALQGTFKVDPSEEKEVRVIRLDHGAEIIPIGSTIRKLYRIPALPLTDEGAEQLPEALLELHSTLGAHGAVAYIEAELFGGSGAQAHVLISRDGAAAGVSVSSNAVNDALAWLGVQTCDSVDRFDAVGLGRHRETDNWLASCDR